MEKLAQVYGHLLLAGFLGAAPTASQISVNVTQDKSPTTVRRLLLVSYSPGLSFTLTR